MKPPVVRAVGQAISTRGILPVLCGSLLVLADAATLPAVTCHCFKDRTYDSSNPAKVDPYLLATAQNSLLAATFRIPRKDVVRAKMSGTAGEDLWVALYAAERLHLSAEGLLGEKKRAGSWKTAFSRQGKSLAPLGPQMVSALEDGKGVSSLAMAAAAETLVARLGSARRDIDDLWSRGASLKELIMATLLSRWSGRPPAKFYGEVKSGRSTWGSQLDGLGLKPGSLEEEIGRILR